MNKKRNTEGSTTSLGSIVKDIRQKAKTSPLFISGLKKLVNSTLEQLGMFVNHRNFLKLIQKLKITRYSDPGAKSKISESIWGAKGDFKFFDEKFERHHNAALGSTANPRTVELYETVDDTRTPEIFSSFGIDLDLLCLNQPEILSFIREHRNQLTREWPTLFLLKSNEGDIHCENYYVVQVSLHDGNDLGISLLTLAWRPGFTQSFRRRVVVRCPTRYDGDVYKSTRIYK